MPRAKKYLNNVPDCQCKTCLNNKARAKKYCSNCGQAASPDKICEYCLFCPNCVAENEKHFNCGHPDGCHEILCRYNEENNPPAGRNELYCMSCWRCLPHCECSPCSICKVFRRLANGRDGCSTCHKCRWCMPFEACECKPLKEYSKVHRGVKEYRRRTSIADIILRDGIKINQARVPFHESGRLEFKLNPLKRFVSVEMEVAGIASINKRIVCPLKLDPECLEINSIVEKWRASLVADMSLPKGGFEINTAPANGDKFVHQITEQAAILEKYGATVRNYYDARKRVLPCGLHVHVDARDMKYYDVRRFLLFYELIEDAIYAMLPGYRRASHFAQKCGARFGLAVKANKPISPEAKKKSPDPIKVSLIDAVYPGIDIPDRTDKRACLDEVRYRAINVHQYFYRGTLEWRHMYGTVKANEIIPWAILVGTVVDFVVRTSDKIINEIIAKNNGREALLRAAAALGDPALPLFIERQWNKFQHDKIEVESPVLGEGVRIDRAMHDILAQNEALGRLVRRR